MRPLRWNPPAAFGTGAVALLASAAIVALQIAERHGVPDLETIANCCRPFLDQDHRLAFG
jgi:hypothetical protein